MMQDYSRPSNRPHAMDSTTLIQAARNLATIQEAGYLKAFKDELWRRCREAGLIGNGWHWQHNGQITEMWAESFGKELASALDAPIHQCQAAAMELLPVCRRKIAVKLLGEMVAEVRTQQAKDRIAQRSAWGRAR